KASPSPLQRGRLALLAAGILWSVGGVFIKQLPVGPVAIAFYRSLFAAATLLLLAGTRQRRGKLPPLRELTVSAFLFAGLLVAFVAATRLTTAANAIMLQYTAPIYVIGLSALLLREPPQRADLAALGL